jgi:hypothetical protein
LQFNAAFRYRKRHENESGGDAQSSAGIFKRKYKSQRLFAALPLQIISPLLTHFTERDSHVDGIRVKKHHNNTYAEDASDSEPQHRIKRKYTKRSSKWKSLAQSSQLREEMFLRNPTRDGTIRPTATRYDTSRCYIHPFMLLIKLFGAEQSQEIVLS